MSIRRWRNELVKSYINFRGWHTDRKLVVIESDDWGTIRMPSRAVYESLAANNPAVANDPFSRYDTLADAADLAALFEVLSRHKDKNGNHPVITANTIMANPDFPAIQAAAFEIYSYERFDQTVLRTQANGKETLALWQEGIASKLFYPQLHGREHVHALAWLRELKQGNTELLQAFEQACFGVPYRSKMGNKRKNLLAAFDQWGMAGEASFQARALEEAAQMFQSYFGYKAISFIAPAYVWHPSLEAELQVNGIRSLQGLAVQQVPRKKQYRRRLHFTGQKNRLGQYYSVRNVFFEPTPKPNQDWVDSALTKTQAAFAAKKPAILSSHRINFIGELAEKNRTGNLKRFDQLLGRMLQKWPQIEFLTSAELVKAIT
ncbi:MAG: hypothetical protein AAFR36_04025 [Bacteroidota bacterium]